jgi:hypothetical protein
MSIATKRGDGGETGLAGGIRVSKGSSASFSVWAPALRPLPRAVSRKSLSRKKWRKALRRRCTRLRR